MRQSTDHSPSSDHIGPSRKLVLGRETLRTLTRDELRLAAGGIRTTSGSGGVSC
jgi:hypothetical protein